MLKFILFLSLFFVKINCDISSLGITYSVKENNFEENLLSYCQAKWISYNYGMKLLYKPFLYSDKLTLSQEETLFENENNKKILEIDFNNLNKINVLKDEDTLYNIMLNDLSNLNNFEFLNNGKFLTLLRKLISPVSGFNDELPKNEVTVAMHICANDEFDSLTNPLKFPSYKFYSDELNKICEFYKNKSLYVCIFSDGDLSDITDYFINEIKHKNIIFDFKKIEDISDFFALTKFDCLIRPNSIFSLIASKLTDYRILISPLSSTFKNGEIIIDKINLEGNLAKYISKPEVGKITLQDVKKYLPSNPIILEGGAYKGNNTVQMSLTWPDSIIYAFEPRPEIFNSLKISCFPFANIHCYDLALSDKKGMQKLHLSAGQYDWCNSLLEPKEHLRCFNYVKYQDDIQVNVISLDEWAQENNISKIDFISLDLQGAEGLALRSGVNLLKTVTVILTRVSNIELFKNLEQFAELKAWLHTQGFILVKEEVISSVEGNALFVKRNI